MKRFDYKKAREKSERFVRYEEGAELYCMSLSAFKRVAKQADARCKVGHLVYVDLKKLEKYIESKRIMN